MKRIFTLPFLIAITLTAFTQERYRDSVFAVIKHTDIVYGTNYDNRDSLWNLLMDIYEPNGDTAALRPIIYFVHGGSFVHNSRTDQSIHKTAEFFAKKGYVTANIEYRVEQSEFDFIYLNFLDKANWYQAIVRATQDLKTAVRFIKEDVAVYGNSYRVDTNKIFIYGSSAGAITALHAVYLDDTVEMATSPFRFHYASLGGLNGGSHPSHNMAGVKAVVSCNGAIERLDYIHNNSDIAYLGFHNTVDPVVPYGTGCFDVVACWLGYYQGGSKIFPRTQSLGMNSEFYPVESISHPVDAVADTATHRMIWEKTTDFLYRMLVPSVPTFLAHSLNNKLEIYPTLNSGSFRMRIPAAMQDKEAIVSIISVNGNCVYTAKAGRTEFLVIDAVLPEGLYVVQLKNNSLFYSAKITVVR